MVYIIGSDGTGKNPSQCVRRENIYRRKEEDLKMYSIYCTYVKLGWSTKKRQTESGINTDRDLKLRGKHHAFM